MQSNGGDVIVTFPSRDDPSASEGEELVMGRQATEKLDGGREACVGIDAAWEGDVMRLILISSEAKRRPHAAHPPKDEEEACTGPFTRSSTR